APTDCGNAGCHLNTYQTTNNPVHNPQGFPIANCSQCHDMIAWTDPGAFNHATTGFPLTNSHQMAPAGKVTACTQCHISNNYTPLFRSRTDRLRERGLPPEHLPDDQ